MFHFKISSHGAIPTSSGQRRGASSMHYGAVTSVLPSQNGYFARSQTPNDIGIQRSMTMPHNPENDRVIRRTVSGGLLMRSRTIDDKKKTEAQAIPHNPQDDRSIRRTFSGGLLMRSRTFDEKKKVSEARASKLGALYEVSDVKNTELNTRGNFKVKVIKYKGAPSVQTITPKEAAKLFTTREKEAQAKKGKDPLLTDFERWEKEKKEDSKARKAALKREKKARSTSVPKPRVGEDNRMRQRALDVRVLEDQSIEVVTISTGISMVPRLNPFSSQVKPAAYKASHRGHLASNGKTYDLPNLC